MQIRCHILVILFSFSLSQHLLANDEITERLEVALEQSGTNRPQIQTALDHTPAEQLPGMRFLIAHMPSRDLQTLSAEFLLENVRVSYESWRNAPWKEAISEEIFLNYLLPYANLNEPRDAWRSRFRKQFHPLVAEAETASQAAVMLNQKLFSLVKVRFSTERQRADQSPLETIESGLASCTGLSILLIDACRAVGVPARFVGTPLWTNKSGNHSWVEIWDQGWHFTGAAEPTGDRLNQGWFTARSATAQRDSRLHAIYAVSYRHTPLSFPLVWDPSIDYVRALNVTDRYTEKAPTIPPGKMRALFSLRHPSTGKRWAANIHVLQGKNLIFKGQTKDERFDPNDHLIAILPQNTKLIVRLQFEEKTQETSIQTGTTEQLFEFQQEDAPPDATSIAALRQFLGAPHATRPPLLEQEFAHVALSQTQAHAAKQALWEDHQEVIRQTRTEEMDQRVIHEGQLRMPFFLKTFGTKPAAGWSLFISLHGGGGAPQAVNDQQWENQKGLYSLEEGLYLAPRAPTNTWNLWHQGHIDLLFDRLLQNLLVLYKINPDRVYLMGYSAGGDGVYQLAPRMADRFAAAAMMAGHPNETSPLGLRNLPFTLHVGGLDSAYNRNKVAASWSQQLLTLQKSDADGYQHLAKIYPDKGHWLDREDASAIPWMAQFERRTAPQRVVWKQDDVTHKHFYWLAVDEDNRHARSEVIAQIKEGRIEIRTSGVQRMFIRLHDQLVNLDDPVEIVSEGHTLFSGRLKRTIATLAKTLAERGDPKLTFSTEVSVAFPPSLP